MGLSEYRRNLDSAKERVLVEGMRGKTRLVKLIAEHIHARGHSVLGKTTGREPEYFYNGEYHAINRKHKKRFFLDEENVRLISEYPAEYYVAENQAIYRHTMRHVHRIWRPTISVIPNIRYEHMEGMGDSILEIAESFALNFRGVDYVLWGDPNNTEVGDYLTEFLKEKAEKVGAEFVDARPPKKERRIPMMEQVYLTDVAMKVMGLRRLSQKEWERIVNDIKKELEPELSKLGVYWYDASKVNDPDSFRLVYEYLKSRTDRPIYILAYLRKDRVDRTYAFKEEFRRLAEDESVVKIWVAGHYTKVPLRIINSVERGKGEKLAEDRIEEALAEVRRNEGLLLLAVNGVCEYMNKVRELLREG